MIPMMKIMSPIDEMPNSELPMTDKIESVIREMTNVNVNETPSMTAPIQRYKDRKSAILAGITTNIVPVIVTNIVSITRTVPEIMVTAITGIERAKQYSMAAIVTTKKTGTKLVPSMVDSDFVHSELIGDKSIPYVNKKTNKSVSIGNTVFGQRIRVVKSWYKNTRSYYTKSCMICNVH